MDDTNEHFSQKRCHHRYREMGDISANDLESSSSRPPKLLTRKDKQLQLPRAFLFFFQCYILRHLSA
jgi:hypothetical protein